jgi:sugar phosphate permease
MKGLFYGWRMVAAGSAMQFVQSTLLLQSFGAYFAILRDDRGWSKTELAGAAALHQMESAILGPVLGWILDRFGPRGVIRVGVLVFGAGFMLLSQIESLLAFYLVFLMTATGASLCGFFPLNFALILWFEKKRARALSSMQFGMAVGGLMVPAVAWSLATYGWRATAFASGVIAILAGWPLAGVIRNKPQNYGDIPDGMPSQVPPELLKKAPGDGTRDFTAREALRTQAFWLLALGHSFSLFVVTGVNVHAITHMKEGLGYSLETASLVITLQTLAQLGGIALGWWLGDRFDKRMICALCMFGHMAGLLCLTYADFAGTAAWAMVAAFALLHGSAWGLRGPFMGAIRADYFGTAAIGMILGLSFMILVVGQIGGPLIPGVIGDITGNYRAGFTVLALLAGLGSVFFLMAKRPPRPRAA